jgi:hypothetical protein
MPSRKLRSRMRASLNLISQLVGESYTFKDLEVYISRKHMKYTKSTQINIKCTQIFNDITPSYENRFKRSNNQPIFSI